MLDCGEREIDMEGVADSVVGQETLTVSAIGGTRAGRRVGCT